MHRGGTALSGGSVERAEAEVAVEQAWSELAAVEREQESARSERDTVERQLEQVRLRGAQLEQVTMRRKPNCKGCIILSAQLVFNS